MTVRNDPEAMIRALARNELSARSRLGYVALLLAAATMTCIVVMLWSTEPRVPARAQAAFLVMGIIGVSWIGLATWVLTTQRVLAARDRVIAGWMAVSFTSLFFVFAVFTAFLGRKPSALGGIVFAGALVWVAVQALRKARRRRSELLERRGELERQLAAPAG